MAEKKPATKRTQASAKRAGASSETPKGFTAEERAAMRERAQELKAAAPGLSPKLWYGMPAYASDGSVVCLFQDATKFKTRYATLGFSDKAMLDDGQMWPTAFALKDLTPADEARIAGLVRKAVTPS